MTARQRAAVLAISVRVLMRANPWNFSVFWSTESELPWNSRACETINAGAWATELLPCECVMRPIAWLCVAPMEFGFDPLLSRSEPRSCFFMPVSAPRSTMLSRCSMPPQPDQLRCRHDRHDRHDNGERCTYRRRNGTKREFFNDFSRACARVRARRGGFGVR